MKLKSGKKLRIGCYDFTLQFKNLDWQEDSNLAGQCDYDRRTIKISDVNPSKMEVLAHEVIHALDSEHKLGLTEQQVLIIGHHLPAFCRDNHIDLGDDLDVG